MQAVSNGEIDIAVCFNAGDARRIKAVALFEEDICLVGSAELVGATGASVALEEALSYPLLLPGRDHVLRGMIDRVALFRNHPIEVRHECLSLHSLYCGLEQGIGATLISKFSALPLWRQGKVVCRRVVEPNVTRRLFVAASAERPITHAQNVVFEQAVACIRASVTRKKWPDTRLVEPERKS